MTVFSSSLVCIFKSTLRFKIKLKTYCPSRRTGADSFALTDASILAGAACLASFIAGHLAAGKMTEAITNKKIRMRFAQIHSSKSTHTMHFKREFRGYFSFSFQM